MEGLCEVVSERGHRLASVSGFQGSLRARGAHRCSEDRAAKLVEAVVQEMVA